MCHNNNYTTQCSSFKEVWCPNNPNWPARRFKKKMLNKSNPLSYITNVSLIVKSKILLHFHPVARVWFLSIGVEDLEFFFINLYLSDSIFRGTVRLISCINMLKEFISIAMVAMEIEKKHYFSYHSNSCREDKVFIKNRNLIHLTQH